MSESSIPRDHPLVGTWESEDRDSPAVFTITAESGALVVTGIDELDGEAFEITDVVWTGEVLRFQSLMPSTGHRAHHVFRLQDDGKVSHELTLYELWTRRDSGRAR